MGVRLKRFYCPRCRRFKNRFQVNIVETVEYSYCRSCGTKCIDVECLLESKIIIWTERLRDAGLLEGERNDQKN